MKPFIPPAPPARRKRLRFTLGALFLLVTCAGPLVLVAAALSQEFYAFQARFTLEVLLIVTVAWYASYVRPAPMAACFLFLIVLSATLGMLLLVGRANDFEQLRMAAGMSGRATLAAGLALGLSFSRHSQ